MSLLARYLGTASESPLFDSQSQSESSIFPLSVTESSTYPPPAVDASGSSSDWPIADAHGGPSLAEG